VTFVLPEELTLHPVSVQMVNILMNKTFAEIATSNVKLALTMPSVLNVLTTPTELSQIPVYVKMDTMKPVLLSVQNVLTNVKPVLLMIPVSNVPLQESPPQDVGAQKTCSTTMVNVNHVLTNVTVVKTPLLTVKNVNSTEWMLQPVTVYQPTMMMDKVKTVKNVTVNVILVMLLDVWSVLVPELMPQNVDAQMVSTPPVLYLLVIKCVLIKSVPMMELVPFVTTNVKLVKTSTLVYPVLPMLGECPHQTVHVKPDIGMKKETQPVECVPTNV
jgi:hypothetical protein